jgi:hypothetical protein
VAFPPLAAAAFRGERLWLIYLLATVGGFMAFCAVFKWQPWHPRLHLPGLALGGVAFGLLCTRRVVCWVAPVAVAGLVLSVVPAATQSGARSLGPPGLSVFRSDADDLRYFGKADTRRDVEAVVARVLGTNPRAVDLINQGSHPWEYTIARGLRRASHPPRVGYFYPVAGSPVADPPADAVIDVGSEHPPSFIRHPQTRRVYRLADRVGNFTVYRPADPAEQPACDQPVARFGIGTEYPPTP